MANPQVEQGYIRIANTIMDEVIRRDFSKRQKDILHLIWRLSYGCGKKSADIPKLKDFALCGVSKQNVKSELEHLETCGVIFWDKDHNKFTFNKNYEEWIITPCKGWKEEEFKQLVHLNIQKKFLKQEQKSSQNKNFEEDNEEGSSQNKNNEVLKIRTARFLKQELRHGLKSCLARAKVGSKDMFKDMFKDNVVVVIDNEQSKKSEGGVPRPTDSIHPIESGEIPSGKDAVDVVAEYFQMKRGVSPEQSLKPREYTMIKQLLLQSVTMDEFKQGIDLAFGSFKPSFEGDTIGSFSYCQKPILKAHHENKQEHQQSLQQTPETQTSRPSKQYNYGF